MIEKGQKQPCRKRGLYTPPAKQSRVIAASLAGKNKSEISREVGIKRDTVARILSQPEVQELLLNYRQQARGLAPYCLAGLKEKLVTRTGKLRKGIDWRMMVEILKGVQVFVPRQEEALTPPDEFAGKSIEQLEYYLDHRCWPGETAPDTGEPVSGDKADRGTKGRGPLPN